MKLRTSLRKLSLPSRLLLSYSIIALTLPSDPILLNCSAYTKEGDHLAQECKAQDILPDKGQACFA